MSFNHLSDSLTFFQRGETWYVKPAIHLNLYMLFKLLLWVRESFSEKELQQGFIEAGFKLTSFESYNDTVFYENAKALKDFVRAWLKSFIPLPEDLHENFLDLLIQECVPYQINKEEPGIRLPYTALLIKASKA